MQRTGLRRGLGVGLVSLLSGATILGVALVTGHAAHEGTITAAEAAGLTLAAVASLEPLLSLVFAALRAPEVAASAERLSEIEQIPLAVHEPTLPTPWPTRSPIVFDLVDASPSLGAPPVLRHASLTIGPGRRVALLGASGAGKSTLSALLLRFVAPTSGSLRIGTVPWAQLDADELRRKISLLDQSPVLFGGTVADTLRLGDPTATDDELKEMLELVDLGQLGDDPLSLSLAEGGTSLSGGQQRRLALVESCSDVLRCCCSTSPQAGLDEEQGRAVLTRALGAASRATVVLCTHHVGETAGFDRIFLLDEGSLTELDETARSALLAESGT